MTSIDRAAIERTYGLIAPYICVTPVVETSGTDFGLAAFTNLLTRGPWSRHLLVSVGGSGLIGGIAAWCGGRPRVIGVEPEAAPTLTRRSRRGSRWTRPRAASPRTRSLRAGWGS